MSLLIATEDYGSSSMRNRYILTHDGTVQLSAAAVKPRTSATLTQFFRSVFLPQGYPDSVSKDYLQYQIWDTIQAFCSSITSTLATRSLLRGFGVGDESATVLSATVTWLLKDGTGMVGRILFAWIQGTYLDCDCKRWRLFADVLNDVAIFLEIIAPLCHQQYFRLIVCTASVSKAVVGVAGGATRAAITQHQARRNNMADVSAKDGSQETMVQLASLLCSLLLMHLISDTASVVWLVYLCLTVVHLYANYRAVTAVTMDTLNQSRLHAVIHHWLTHRQVLSVSEANRREPVLTGVRRYFTFNVGCSVQRLTDSGADVARLCTLFADGHYLLSVNTPRRSIDIVLGETAEFRDQLMACYHAEVIDYCYTAVRCSTSKLLSDERLQHIALLAAEGDTVCVVRDSYQYVVKSWRRLCDELVSAGWLVSPVLLAADEWRAHWSQQQQQQQQCDADDDDDYRKSY